MLIIPFAVMAGFTLHLFGLTDQARDSVRSLVRIEKPVQDTFKTSKGYI